MRINSPKPKRQNKKKFTVSGIPQSMGAGVQIVIPTRTDTSSIYRLS